MNTSSSCLSNEKSSSENFSYNSSQGMPLDESFDSKLDSKSSLVNNKSKKNKFLSMTIKNGKRLGKRKRKEDNIRKRIKTCALKNIMEKLNKTLTKAGSKYTFKALPQHFIADISRKTNHEVMHLTFKELLEYAYKKLFSDKNYNTKKYNETLFKAAKEKYKINCKTLEYLDSIQETNLKSVWEQIKNTKYVVLLRDFFQSNEFKKSFEKLKEDQNYIDSYKYFAETYVEFFLNYELLEENNTKGPIPNDNTNSEQNIDTPNPELNNINNNVTPNQESNSLPNQDLEINIIIETPYPDPNNSNDNGEPDLEFNPNIFNPHPIRDWLDFPIVSYDDMPLYFLMNEDIDLLESFNSSSEAVIKRENNFLTIL